MPNIRLGGTDGKTAAVKSGRRVNLSSPYVVLFSLLLGLAAGTGLLPYLKQAGVPAVISALDIVGSMWINAIRMTVIPLIVPLLVSAVAGSGSGRSVGALGIWTTIWFIGLLALAAGVSLPVATSLFGQISVDPATTYTLQTGSAGTNPLPTGDASVETWLKTLIPTNPVKAAADGNLLSLVVFTLAFGLASRSAPEAIRARVLEFSRSMSEVMLILVHSVVRLAPIGVFSLTLVAATRFGSLLASSIAFYLVAEVTAFNLATVFVAALGIAWTRMTPRLFLAGAAPAMLIAFGTSSSLSSLPAMIEGALEKWKLPDDVVGFVLPLAVSTFKLSAGVSWVFMPVFIAALYGVHLGPPQLLLIGVYAVVMNATVPGIPGGAAIAVMPLFIAVGVPVEGLAIPFAVTPIADRFATVLNVAADLTVTAILGRNTASAAIA